MVDEFSRFARMRRPMPDDVDLQRLVSETVGLYDGIKEGVTVDARVEDEASTARVDGEQLKQVLINLLDNAVSAIESPGAVDVRATRENGLLRLRIADTGRGIPREDRAKLFLPHFSTKRRGSGLGLAIVHRIVTEHHGTVSVEDNDPHGTVFTIEIPQD